MLTSGCSKVKKKNITANNLSLDEFLIGKK